MLNYASFPQNPLNYFNLQEGGTPTPSFFFFCSGPNIATTFWKFPQNLPNFLNDEYDVN